MTETAAHRLREHRSGGSQPLMFLLWVAFVALMGFSSGTLDSVWAWLRGLPAAAEVVMWIVMLPWALGLLVWESSWDAWVRWVVILAMAFLWTGLFAPRR